MFQLNSPLTKSVILFSTIAVLCGNAVAYTEVTTYNDEIVSVEVAEKNEGVETKKFIYDVPLFKIEVKTKPEDFDKHTFLSTTEAYLKEEMVNSDDEVEKITLFFDQSRRRTFVDFNPANFMDMKESDIKGDLSISLISPEEDSKNEVLDLTSIEEESPEEIVEENIQENIEALCKDCYYMPYFIRGKMEVVSLLEDPLVAESMLNNAFHESKLSEYVELLQSAGLVVESVTYDLLEHATSKDKISEEETNGKKVDEVETTVVEMVESNEVDTVKEDTADEGTLDFETIEVKSQAATEPAPTSNNGAITHTVAITVISILTLGFVLIALYLNRKHKKERALGKPIEEDNITSDNTKLDNEKKIEKASSNIDDDDEDVEACISDSDCDYSVQAEGSLQYHKDEKMAMALCDAGQSFNTDEVKKALSLCNIGESQNDDDENVLGIRKKSYEFN